MAQAICILCSKKITGTGVPVYHAKAKGKQPKMYRHKGCNK